MPTFMPASPDAFTEADCGHTHAESARAERRLRIGELGLVLGVAFGSPVFANVHPLLGGGRAYGPFADLYAVLHLVLQIALALALLGRGDAAGAEAERETVRRLEAAGRPQ